MHKKIYIFFFVLLLILIFYSVYSRDRYLAGYKKIKTVIGVKAYTLFVADNEVKKQKGLSNISAIRKNEGMLFIFEKPDYYHFWMKDMKFPLDFIFLNGNKIVDMIPNIPPTSYPNTFTSAQKADTVIELNSGQIEKLHLQKGTNIFFTANLF